MCKYCQIKYQVETLFPRGLFGLLCLFFHAISVKNTKRFFLLFNIL